MTNIGDINDVNQYWKDRHSMWKNCMMINHRGSMCDSIDTEKI